MKTKYAIIDNSREKQGHNQLEFKIDHTLSAYFFLQKTRKLFCAADLGDNLAEIGSNIRKSLAATLVMVLSHVDLRLRALLVLQHLSGKTCWSRRGQFHKQFI